MVDGVASGSVDVPVGSSRVFSARLYDAGGTETHRGEVTTAVRPGANDAIALRLEPLTGEPPVDVVISSYTITIVPSGTPAVLGRPLQMHAVVHDADGREVPDAKVLWAVTVPQHARISPAGLLEFSVEGYADVVAVYGGVAATVLVEGMSAARFAEDRLRASFVRWWDAEAQYFGNGFMLSAQTFQHSATAANWGTYLYSEYPRTAIVNDPSHQYYAVLTNAWTFSYEGIAALRQGRQAVGEWPDLRAKAFSEFMLGLHLGNVALLYDQGLVIDDTQDPATAQLRPYAEVMAAAVAHLDQGHRAYAAGQLLHPLRLDDHADGQRSAAPAGVLVPGAVPRQRGPHTTGRGGGRPLDTGDRRRCRQRDHQRLQRADRQLRLVQQRRLLHDPGVELFPRYRCQFLGMADQSGKYQTSINLPVADRHPVLPGGVPFAIITPDNRFPQGATIEAQRMSPGTVLPGDGVHVLEPAGARHPPLVVLR